jgi:hypothetical protein
MRELKLNTLYNKAYETEEEARKAIEECFTGFTDLNGLVNYVIAVRNGFFYPVVFVQRGHAAAVFLLANVGFYVMSI